MKNKEAAENFLKLSQNFLNSAKVLEQNISLIRPFPFASIFFCTGHSIELSLKSFLLFNDMAEEEIKTHDLDRLIDLAKLKGAQISFDNSYLIEVLNESYKGHYFRYPHMGDLTLPMHFEAIDVAQALIEGVSQLIGSNGQEMKNAAN